MADKGPTEEICCLGLTPEGEGEAGGKQIKLTCKSPIFSRVNENNVPRESIESIVVTNLWGV